MIEDYREVERFTNEVFCDLQPHECRMVALYSRKKYGWVDYQYGRILFRHNVYDAIVQLCKMYGEYTPSLVTYISVNPIDGVAAYHNFQQAMSSIADQALRNYIGQKNPDLSAFASMESKLLSAYQRAIASSPWIDIDVDGDASILSLVTEGLSDYMTIKTHGGYHVLVHKDRLGGVQLGLNVKRAHNQQGEVVFNRQRLIPLPGTLQGGKLVTCNIIRPSGHVTREQSPV